MKSLFNATAMTAVLFLTSLGVAYAAKDIPIYLVNETGQGKSIGSIKLEEAECGVLIKPHLQSLPPGVHGFHIHVNPSCDNNGMAAGGHFDPEETDKHEGPYSEKGHLGDLPILVVNSDGIANLPTLAPRLKLSDLSGHSIMIHAGGDNYSDVPEKLGGGGARLACGVIK